MATADESAPQSVSDSIEFLSSILGAASDTIVAATPDGEFLFVNRFTHNSPDVVKGRTIFDFVAPEDAPRVREIVAEVRRTKQPSAWDTHLVRAGQVAYYHTRVAPVIRDGEVIALALVATDVTRARENERALAESEQRLRMAVAATGMGLWTWDALTDSIQWDDQMHAIFGAVRGSGPKRGADYFALIHPEDRPEVERRLQKAMRGKIASTEYRIVRPDGQVRWVHVRAVTLCDASGRLERLMGGTLDVTERRSVDERLREAQRAESIGRLTAGFAHNFNNLLMTILPNLELASRSPEKAQECLHLARLGAERAAEIVRQLLVFAGKRTMSPRVPQMIPRLIERTLEIFRAMLGPGVELELTSDGELPRVSGDASQLEQVFLNLLLNARDAVRGVAAPRIAVVVESAVVEDHPYVHVRVTDNGVGVDEATRARLFEPFFTTKPPGEGTGLGLTSALAIVRDHGGELWCDSRAGAGATFTVRLPCLSELEDETPPRLDLCRGCRVLLIDDDRAVLSSTAALLREGGHEVDTATSGAEGLRLFGATRGRYDAVLVDLSMPDMPGTAVCRTIRERAPDQPVLYFSGFPVEELGDADGFVSKPVDIDTLRTRIAIAIAARRERSAR
jgi:two-component system cell cycle sensor histidine kinase/response regulator CckA